MAGYAAPDQVISAPCVLVLFESIRRQTRRRNGRRTESNEQTSDAVGSPEDQAFPSPFLPARSFV